MCGRYRNQQSDPQEFGHRFGGYGQAIGDALGKIEVRPTDPIVRAERADEAGGDSAAPAGDGPPGRVAETVRWGFQPPNAKRPLINARDDKLLTSGLWKRSLLSGDRILIPADGWYEWLSAEDPKVKKQPFLHTVDGGAPFAFAGLLGYAIVKGEKVAAATIITTSSAGAAARIHDRMPVILESPEAEEAWLTADADETLVSELCVPLGDGRVDVQPITLEATAKAGGAATANAKSSPAEGQPELF